MGAEVDLHIPAYIPESLIRDVNIRLRFYKRIANAEDEDQLSRLQVEMIDRFGLLPDICLQLFAVTRLKLKAKPLGIKKLTANAQGGHIEFFSKAAINPMKIIELVQNKNEIYSLAGSDKLRFKRPSDSADKRIEVIHNILDELTS